MALMKDKQFRVEEVDLRGPVEKLVPILLLDEEEDAEPIQERPSAPSTKEHLSSMQTQGRYIN